MSRVDGSPFSSLTELIKQNPDLALGSVSTWIKDIVGLTASEYFREKGILLPVIEKTTEEKLSDAITQIKAFLNGGHLHSLSDITKCGIGVTIPTLNSWAKSVYGKPISEYLMAENLLERDSSGQTTEQDSANSNTFGKDEKSSEEGEIVEESESAVADDDMEDDPIDAMELSVFKTLEYLKTRYNVRQHYDHIINSERSLLYKVRNSRKDIMWVYYIHTKSSHYISIETEPEYLEDVHDFPGFTQIQKRAAHPRQKMLFEDYGAIRNTLVVICDSIDRFFAPYFPAPSNKPAITESAQETSPKDRISFILETIGLPYIDMRPKGGNLWVLGSDAEMRAVESLKSMGYPFVYCPNGSKSTQRRSGWYLDESRRESKTVEGQIALADVTAEPDSSEMTAEEKRLEPDLLNVLSGKDMQLLRRTLAAHGILTIDQLAKTNLWTIMNRYAIYSIRQRQDIYQRVMERLEQARKTDRAQQYELKTRSASYYGNTPAEAFASFCEALAKKYPLKLRSLLDAQHDGRGSIVLFKENQGGITVRMLNTTAYVDKNLTSQAALIYGQWLCKKCGDNALPIKLEEPENKPLEKSSVPVCPDRQIQPATAEVFDQTEAYQTKKSDSAATQPETSAVPVKQTVRDKDIAKAEKLVLKADLDGISMEELSQGLLTTVAATKRIVAASRHIVQLNDRLIHDDAFVDWVDGADQMEKILDKLLDKNDGYASAAQLYDYARLEMQMFLNDNDMDNAGRVYDMAQHLFGKIDYHGKHLAFQGRTHISRGEAAVSSIVDLGRNYAMAHGGIFREEDFVQYLQSAGVKTGNLRGLMKVYTEPYFLFYDSGTYILAESMKINEDWFAVVQKALDNLFEDMGDHIVLRDIQPLWFALLPPLPGGNPWTLLLVQSVLFHYSKKLGGVHTIAALNMQTGDTLQAMLVSGDSEIQTFPDAVAAYLIDDGIEQREFCAEELRQLLVQRGMIAGNEVVWNMHKALANDSRFLWSSDNQQVTVRL